MRFLDTSEINETLRMIHSERLDIRTITLGISLLDCAAQSGETARQRIYDKITTRAENLVAVAEEIETEYGIPIINKRISVTPISLLAAAGGEEDYVAFATTLDRAAHTVGVNFIGGFSALVHKGYTRGDEVLVRSIPEALAATERVCSSVNVATTRTGINMDAVRQMGEVILETAERTASQGGIGCAKLVVFANAAEDNPFMAGAFHGIGEPECVVNVGVSGPGAVKSALEHVKGADLGTVSETIKRTAFKVTRMGQLVAREASRRLGVPFGIVDLSLAPTPVIGDSVAHILEEMGLERCGAAGSTAALALLNDAVKKGGTMATSYAGGLSGAFIPVVGRSLADAMDSVLGTALVLKNALGLIGAVAILFICALPAIQILLQALVFRIAGALIQPLGEEKLAEAVTGMGNSLILLFASLTICGLFAYFTLALLVGLGNITMMMR